MNKSRTAMLALLILLTVPQSWLYADAKPQPMLDTVQLSINGIAVTAEVAAHPKHRQKGLSYRTSMPANAGMLFVYQSARPLVFTMRETLIPLSIAFISEDLTINEIIEMEPGAQTNYPSRFSSKFALEMNQGWFAKHKITTGAKITISY